MEPAVFRLAVVQADPELFAALAAELARQGDPPIAMAREPGCLRFDCATWDMLLRSRVMQALGACSSHGAWQRCLAPR